MRYSVSVLKTRTHDWPDAWEPMLCAWLWLWSAFPAQSLLPLCRPFIGSFSSSYFTYAPKSSMKLTLSCLKPYYRTSYRRWWMAMWACDANQKHSISAPDGSCPFEGFPRRPRVPYSALLSMWVLVHLLPWLCPLRVQYPNPGSSSFSLELTSYFLETGEHFFFLISGISSLNIFSILDTLMTHKSASSLNALSFTRC